LLTRDHVARCILREIRAGRGSPHGGVYLDIAWIKEKLPHAEEHIKRKLPSMYHQFKQLAGIDITREPMEVGPTTHYIMGGIRVDGDTQMSSVPGLFAAGECAAGLHGANRLGGNSLSDLLVFGRRAGAHAAAWARDHEAGSPDPAEVRHATSRALEPFERADTGESPFQVQHELQAMMQDKVGIVRREEELREAITRLEEFRSRAATVGVSGHREYNPGWHTAIDLGNLLTIAEGIARSALDRRESRGGHFRDDFPDKDGGIAAYNTVVQRTADGRMSLRRVPIPPLSPELSAIVVEQRT